MWGCGAKHDSARFTADFRGGGEKFQWDVNYLDREAQSLWSFQRTLAPCPRVESRAQARHWRTWPDTTHWRQGKTLFPCVGVWTRLNATHIMSKTQLLEAVTASHVFRSTLVVVPARVREVVNVDARLFLSTFQSFSCFSCLTSVAYADSTIGCVLRVEWPQGVSTSSWSLMFLRAWYGLIYLFLYFKYVSTSFLFLFFLRFLHLSLTLHFSLFTFLKIRELTRWGFFHLTFTSTTAKTVTQANCKK